MYHAEKILRKGGQNFVIHTDWRLVLTTKKRQKALVLILFDVWARAGHGEDDDSSPCPSPARVVKQVLFLLVRQIKDTFTALKRFFDGQSRLLWFPKRISCPPADLAGRILLLWEMVCGE